MTIEVRVPQLPESVADATLVSWHKKPGDNVVLEVPAPAAGVIKEIKLADGTTVTSGQLLAVIDETATAAAVPGASAPAILAASSGATAAAKDAVAKTETSAGTLSPAAKRVAEENRVDP